MKYIATSAAILGYGTWAYFANCYADMPAAVSVALRAAIIQGSYAGGLTLINVYVLELLFDRLSRSLSILFSGTVAVLMALSAQYALIIPVHILNQTPNILATLAPGLVIGSIFSCGYVYRHASRARL